MRAALCAAAAALPRGVAGAAPKPHILFSMVDDLGWYNVPWNNPDLAKAMPRSLDLVKQGVQLDRHYAYQYCSPSRCSTMSGRLPYHVNQVNIALSVVGSGIPRNMTTIPRKLKSAGYKTHMAGKWHLGMESPAHTPHGRGFDTSLNYFSGAEDHWTQGTCVDQLCNKPNGGWGGPSNKTFPRGPMTDLWLTDGPAVGINGTAYGDELFRNHIITSIQKHDASEPYFAYWAIQNNHEPLQVAASYEAQFPTDWEWERRAYAAMGAYWDESMGMVADAFRAKGMWDSLLWIMSGDNGGPIYPSLSRDYPYCGGANNYPHRGGKSTSLEGGVRVAAFATGGLLPEAVRGTTSGAYVHLADWYATFLGLAGVSTADPEAAAAGLPAPDSIDMWPLLSRGEAQRTEVPLAVDGQGQSSHNGSALIVGDMKVLAGTYANAFWSKEAFPDASKCCKPSCWASNPKLDCGTIEKPTCLFNITADPGEHDNLAEAMPDVVAKLAARLLELRATGYYPDRSNNEAAAFHAASVKNGGYFTPWLQ